MIIVRVELHSAITHKITELARMKICNIGSSEEEPPNPKNRHWNYSVETFVGRNAKALDKERANRQGEVREHLSDRLHVWYLIAKALRAIHYTGE